jgi:hypothetical protein
MKFQDRILKMAKFEEMDRDALEDLARAQNQLLNNQAKIKTNQSYWTESVWYGIGMYVFGLGSGAFMILTIKALGVIK